MTVAIERARAAHAEIAAARAAVDAEFVKLAELKRSLQLNQDEAERLRADEYSDAAKRVLDGDEAAPKKPRRVNKLAALDEAIPAGTAAIQMQRARIAEAEAATQALQPSLVATSLDVVADVQGDAVEAARALLGGLAPSFARLIAADQIRAATIGERFAMPEGAKPPFSGLAIIRNFAKAIPDRLRPPELAEMALFDAAHAISSPIINDIKGA